MVTPDGGVPVTCHKIHEVKDEVAPVLLFNSGTTPIDTEVGYSDIPVADDATASDACDGVITVQFTEHKSSTPFGSPDLDKYAFSIVRSWTATDKCGNVDSVTQSLDVTDTEAPVFSNVPVDETLPCEDDLPACATPDVTDNSGEQLAPDHVQTRIDGSCDNDYSIVRTWTAEDAQGNVGTASQTVTFVDIVAPTLVNIPASPATAECDVIPDPPVVDAQDACDKQVQIDYSEALESQTSVHSFVVTRTWTATDACGNTASETATLTIEDTQAPVVEIEADATIECYGHTPTACASAITDNCDDNPSLSFSEAKLDGSCINEYQLVHTYTVSDDTGNSVTAQRTIAVVDSAAPVLKGVPADVTADCSAPTYPAVTAFDLCQDGQVITANLTTDTVPTATGATVTNTWTATDNCGQVATEQQVIELSDTVPPVLHGVPTSLNVNVGCNMVPDVPTVTSSDACCDIVDVIFSQDTIAGLCDTEYTLIRTWDAEDCHGNVASVTQTINVHSVDPVLTNLPIASMEVQYTEQGQQVAAAAVGVKTWCGEVLVVGMTESIVTGSCDNNWVIVREFSVTNDCGSDSYTQSITIVDTTSPTISTPANRYSNCTHDATPWGVTASDTDGVTLIPSESCVNDDPVVSFCSGVRTCTFTATDACGNQATTSAVNTWSDTAPPVLVGDCAVEEVTEATDSCEGTLPVVKTSTTETADFCTIIHVDVDTFTATDSCGLSTSCIRSIPVFDTESPVIADVPASATYECSAAVPALADLVASDNYDTSVTSATGTEFSTPKSCATEIVRTWSVCDCANNCAQETQTITIQEVTAPTVTFSGDVETSQPLIRECPFTPPVETMTVVTFCGYTATESAITSATDSVHVHRYFWTDGCLSVDQAQTVLVRDTTPPSVIVSDSTNDCTWVPVPATGTDTCSAASCEVTSTTNPGSQSASCDLYTNTWTCTDAAGNTATAEQTIEAVDNQGPSIDQTLTSVTVECPNSHTVPTVTYSDNCEGTALSAGAPTVDDARYDGTVGTGLKVYTWTVTDRCGLTDTATQSVTFTDTSAPVFSDPINDVYNAQCAPDPALVLTAADDCAGPVDVVVTQESAANCAHDGQVIYTYTATDLSGNPVQAAQTIIYEDKNPPTIDETGLPNAQIDITDSESVDDYDPTTDIAGRASDDCGTATPSCTYTQESAGNGCQTRFIFNCMVADDCGNQIPLPAYLTVLQTHTYDVTLSPKSPDSVIGCQDSFPAEPVVSAPDGTVSFSGTQQISGSFAACSTWTRTWSVDYCDHSESHTQTITVSDANPPTITMDTYSPIQCMANLPTIANSTASASDDCDASPSLSITDSSTTIAAGHVEVTRTYSAADECGNAATDSVVITVKDDTPPTLTNVPADVTISCSAALPTTVPSYSDNCGSVVLTSAESVTIGACACDYTTTRTWTATDAAGNTATGAQNVKVQDITPPVFDSTPQSTVSVPWADWSANVGGIATPETLTATDNIDGATDIIFSEVTTAGSSPHQFEVNRTWTTSDACGNTAEVTQYLVVFDNVPPEDCLPPATVTVRCHLTGTIVTAEQVGADCAATLSEDVEVTYQTRTETGSCTDNYNIIDDYTVTDLGGNAATFSRTVTVIDDEAPVADAHATSKTTSQTDAQCSAEGPISVTFTDLCSTPTVTPVTTESPAGTFTTVYTAVDDCGNTATAEVVEYLVDQTAPTILDGDGNPVVGTDITIQADCAEGTLPTYTCSEVCGLTCSIAMTSNDLTESCNHAGVRTQVWTASDDAGNTATFTHIVNYVDATGPVVTPAADFTCACGQTDCFPSATVVDNCDANPSLDNVEDPDVDATRIYTFTSTDNCGNVGTAVQTVTGHNDVPPVFTGGDDYEASCTDLKQNIPTCVDECGATTVTELADVVTAGADCATDGILETRVREFTCVDQANHSVSHFQTITIKDSDAPVLSNVPASPIHRECDEPTFNVVASDTCTGTVAVQENRVPVGDDIEVTWTATDECGKVATDSVTFNVQDTIPPVASPASLAIEIVSCRALPAVPNVTFTDNCGGAVSSSMTPGTWTGSCDNDGVYIRTWTGVDASGLTSSISQTIISQSTTAPTCTVDPAQSISCEDSYAEPADQVVCTDMCGNVIDSGDITRVDNLSPTCGSGSAESGNVQWTATDACGLTVTATQNREKKDEIDPTFSDFPADTSFDCAPEAPATPNAVDTCGDVTVSSSSVLTETCAHSGTGVTTFTATDSCGNTYSQSHTAVYSDNAAPEFSSLPADETIDCSAASIAIAVTANDICSGDVTVDVADVSEAGTGDIKSIIVRTFTAQDACGASAVHTHSISKQDTTAPVLIGNFDDLQIQCLAIPAQNVSCTDDCGACTVVTDEQITSTCGSTSVAHYTFTATDEVGLTAVQTRTIEVVDSQQPTLSFSGAIDNATYECGVDIPSVTCTASDSCDPAVTCIATETEETSVGSVNLIRSFLASDHCGNAMSEEYTITILDSSPPVITAPGDSTHDCADAHVAPVATVVDVCDDSVTLDESLETTYPCDGSIVHIYTWTATDSASLIASTSTTMTYADSKAPTFTVSEVDATFECGSVPPLPDFESPLDDCGTVNLVKSVVDVTGAAACPTTNVTQYTLSAEDSCGNQAAAVTVTYTFEDTLNPEISAVPFDDVTVAAGTAVAAPEVTVVDQCSEATWTYSSSETADANRCNVIEIRVIDAVDECGNTASLSQTVTIEEGADQGPTLHDVPDSITIECGTQYSLVEPYATDRTGRFLSVVESQVTTLDPLCGCQGSHVHTYSTSDSCGRTDMATTTVTIVDTTAPVMTCMPANQAVSCDETDIITVHAQHYATDSSAAGLLNVSFHEVTEAGSCDHDYKLIRTYTVQDCSANEFTHVVTVSVTDDSAPAFTSDPVDATIECSCNPHELVLADIDAQDNCDSSPTIVADEDSVSSANNDYQVVRSWSTSDTCGNAASKSQTVTVQDTTAPVIIGVRADITVDCGDIAYHGSASNIYADDGCQGELPVTLVEVRVDGGCPGEYDLIRTYTAADLNGNTATETQTVSVIDEEAPVQVKSTETCLGPPDGHVYTVDLFEAFYSLDNCDPEETIVVTPISCNATEIGFGDINDSSPFDAGCSVTDEIVSITVTRFAEYAPGAAREYVLYAQVSDQCGNTETRSHTFSVPAPENTVGCVMG